MSASVLDGLHALVLAAGASTRFGSTKQLVRLAGRPMMHTAVARAVDIAGSGVTVVLGAQAAELAPLLRHSPASIAINRDWREGLASSIRTGVARLPPGCSAVLILLADQPAVTTEDLRRLTQAWQRQSDFMAAASYDGTVGVPAIFPRTCFSDLTALRGDSGARQLLQRNPDRIVRVAMASAAIDIDTPEDLLALSRQEPPQAE
jgi:molybdenum cofactor cytidylyltransferase